MKDRLVMRDPVAQLSDFSTFCFQSGLVNTGWQVWKADVEVGPEVWRVFFQEHVFPKSKAKFCCHAPTVGVLVLLPDRFLGLSNDRPALFFQEAKQSNVFPPRFGIYFGQALDG